MQNIYFKNTFCRCCFKIIAGISISCFVFSPCCCSFWFFLLFFCHSDENRKFLILNFLLLMLAAPSYIHPFHSIHTKQAKTILILIQGVSKGWELKLIIICLIPIMPYPPPTSLLVVGLKYPKWKLRYSTRRCRGVNA